MICFKLNLQSKTAKENISVQADLTNWVSYRAGLNDFKKRINATLTELVDSEGNFQMTHDSDCETDTSDDDDDDDTGGLKRPLNSPVNKEKASKLLKT